jgi:hypothetical protein
VNVRTELRLLSEKYVSGQEVCLSCPWAGFVISGLELGGSAIKKICHQLEYAITFH